MAHNCIIIYINSPAQGQLKDEEKQPIAFDFHTTYHCIQQWLTEIIIEV